MCLAIPAKIVSKRGNIAKVDFGDGITRKVNVTLVDADVGKYVIVHAGFAIQIMDEYEAKETLRIWESILEK